MLTQAEFVKDDVLWMKSICASHFTALATYFKYFDILYFYPHFYQLLKVLRIYLA